MSALNANATLAQMVSQVVTSTRVEFPENEVIEPPVPSVPLMEERVREANSLLGLCDRVFRAKGPSADDKAPPPVCKWTQSEQHKLVHLPEGGGVRTTPEFRAACASRVGASVEPPVYGTPGGAVHLCVEALNNYAIAQRASTVAVSRVLDLGAFGSPPCVANLDDAYAKLGRALKQDHAKGAEKRSTDEPNLGLVMRACHFRLKQADATWEAFRLLVSTHLEGRRDRGACYIATIADDLLGQVARHLDCTSSIAFRRTCKAYSLLEDIKKQIPHLRIRSVEGFPHFVRTSVSRADVQKGTAVAKKTDFLIRRRRACVVIDLARRVQRAVPLSDGAQCPSSLERRGPHCLPSRQREHARAHAYRIKHGLLAAGTPLGPLPPLTGSCAREREAWLLHEGPQEPVSPDHSFYRTSFDAFEKGLALRLCLVYADDHTEVPCERHSNALEHVAAVVRSGGVFHPPPERGSASRGGWVPAADAEAEHYNVVPATAHVKCGVLSSEHGGRLFKVRATGIGTDRSGAQVQLEAYSNPFECVSKETVVCNAGKRKSQADAASEKRRK